MKTKLLTVFTIILTVLNIYSQPNTSDYVSGLVEPNGIIAIGTDLYVHGFEDIYIIDTTNPTPVANSIHTSETNFFITDIVINGTTLYMAQENYIIPTDTWLGSRIVSLDLNNIAAPVEVIFSNPMEYISGLTTDGNTLYFSAETLINPPNFEPFFTHIDKLDITQVNPVPVNIVPNISNNGVVGDMILHNNNLLISVRDDQKVYGVDTTINNPSINTVVDGLSFNRGIFENGNELYIADGSRMRKIELDNPSASLIDVAYNTTYEDMNNGMPFYANFRDIALIGNRMYMPLQNQGMIVSAIDITLSIDEFDTLQFSLYPNPAKNQFTIQLDASVQLEQVIVYNILGQEVLTSKNIVVNTSNLVSGSYFVKVSTSKGKTTKKLIIE
ncbi:T9SS type A sorting domain-containing protein [Ichthyenterobacterium magnum]|uniref:Putative secreted protein (Por secretion system target) n=1 Tax=Ichthyenterobacterium magnum TaxID=1230530 RepID=A0A420DX48_9FLAO|nr:T9SS type A sorting domain-containing protein [Ichthyenterobacterium magnum]RKE98786.1 putative secreted protein (Por secretion system target) [Ichthyenterobacterium magnum]